MDPKSVAFRNHLNLFFHDVVDLPKGAFKDAGTFVETCIVWLDKPLDEAY